MKEMKENIKTGIIQLGVQRQCDELTAYLDEFEHELYSCLDGSDFHGYLTDMLCDCYRIERELLHSDVFISDELTVKINKWYGASQELLFDLRTWLRNTCNVTDNIYKRISKRIGE